MVLSAVVYLSLSHKKLLSDKAHDDQYSVSLIIMRKKPQNVAQLSLYNVHAFFVLFLLNFVLILYNHLE